MTMPNERELMAARAVLMQDREGFIALAPTLGITRKIARQVFASPRPIRECLWIFGQFARNRMDGKAEALVLIAMRCPDMKPATVAP